jgi:predicted Zn-dependent peptidase
MQRFLIIPAIMSALILNAQHLSGANDAPVGATEFKPLTFSEFTLPNGLHVILHQNKTAPVVSTYVLYKVGSKDEVDGRTGFAHFFEHLMFEGSRHIERGRIDKLVSGAGGNLNASTSFDQTDYYLNLPKNQLELALWIESERMLHAKVDETGVETQRKVVKEERRNNYDNQPYGDLFEQLCAMLYPGTCYSWVPIGSVQHIDNAQIDEFRAFYKRHYLPNNATLAIAGDIDPEVTRKLVEAYFGDIPAGTLAPRPKFSLPPTTAPVKRVVRQEMTPLNASLHAWVGPSETDDDAYALDLLTNILARGRSSRLYKTMVDKEQAALDIEAFAELLEFTGLVGVFSTGQKGVALERLDALMEAEVAKVRNEGVTEEEFQKALNSKEAELASANGTMAARARNLARYHVFYGSAARVNEEWARYGKVRREDLQRVAQKFFAPNRVHILHYPAPEATSAAPEGK